MQSKRNSIKDVDKSALVMKYILSSAIWFGSFAFGISYNVIPSILVELKNKYETDIQDVSKVFTILLFTYVAGALICGTLFNYLNRQLMLTALMYVLGACVFLVPYLPSKTLLFVVGGFHGFTSGGIDTAQIVWILELWKGQAGVYVQTHYFFFALGTFVAPLIVSPYLREEVINGGNNNSTRSNSSSLLINSTSPLCLSNLSSSGSSLNPSNYTSFPNSGSAGVIASGSEMMMRRLQNATWDPANYSTAITEALTPHPMNGTTCLLLENELPPSQLHIPFSICGALILLSASYILFLFVYRRYESQPDTEAEIIRKKSVGSIDLEIGWTSNKILMVILATITLSAYQGMEVSSVQFMPTFAHVIDLKLPEPQAAQVAQGLAGAFTLGRLFGILIVIFKIPPTLILVGNLLISFIGNMLLCISANSNLTSLWAGSILIGIGYSTIFPCLYDYIEKYLTVTNSIGTIFIVAGGMMAGIYPLVIIGPYVEDYPLVLTYSIFVSISLCTIAFACLYLMTMRRRKNHSISSDEYTL